MPVPVRQESILSEVLRANLGRDPKRVRLKLKKMRADSFAFFRGACHLFVRAWEDLQPPDAGPEILVCGDLHLENFGAYRDADGEFLYDVNDFDESVVAPCAVDLVRCATSILLAAELWGLSPLQASGLGLSFLDEYRAAVSTPAHLRMVDAAAPRISRGPVWDLLGKAATASQSELLDGHTERLKDGSRRIARRRHRHPRLDRVRREAVAEAVHEYGQSHDAGPWFTPLDVTGRIAGVGSLGVQRYLVLVAGGGSAETNRLFDVKECVASAWDCRGRPDAGPEAVGSGPGEAERVVSAQRALQARPAAGLDTIAIGPEVFRLREMVPEENVSSLDRFQKKPRKLSSAVITAGALTGLMHLRGAQSALNDAGGAALADWLKGPALDSVLATAARHAARIRGEFKTFRAELRAPDTLEQSLGAVLTD